MIPLLIFVGGIIFYGFILPILNDIVELVDAKKTLKISKINVGISTNNKEIKDLSDNGGQENISAMGFQYNSPEYEYEDDEESSDYNKRRIGF